MSKPWRVYQLGDKDMFMITDGRDQFVGGEHDHEWRPVGRIGNTLEDIREMASNPGPVFAALNGHGFHTLKAKEIWPNWQPSA